jgi:hypothetical protein
MDNEGKNLLNIVVDCQLSGPKRPFWMPSTRHYVNISNRFSFGIQCIHKYWIY